MFDSDYLNTNSHEIQLNIRVLFMKIKENYCYKYPIFHILKEFS